MGPKRVEGTGDWGKLRNEELHDFCSSPNIIRVMRWGGACDVCTRFWWVILGKTWTQVR